MVTTLQPRPETLYQEAPATAAVSDKVHNIIQMLSEKLDCVWRYDKYMEDCGADEACRSAFRRMKEDDLKHIQMLRDEVERLCRVDDFR